jgi:hypothetical protein
MTIGPEQSHSHTPVLANQIHVQSVDSGQILLQSQSSSEVGIHVLPSSGSSLQNVSGHYIYRQLDIRELILLESHLRVPLKAPRGRIERMPVKYPCPETRGKPRLL